MAPTAPTATTATTAPPHNTAVTHGSLIFLPSSLARPARLLFLPPHRTRTTIHCIIYIVRNRSSNTMMTMRRLHHHNHSSHSRQIPIEIIPSRSRPSSTRPEMLSYSMRQQSPRATVPTLQLHPDPVRLDFSAYFGVFLHREAAVLRQMRSLVMDW